MRHRATDAGLGAGNRTLSHATRVRRPAKFSAFAPAGLDSLPCRLSLELLPRSRAGTPVLGRTGRPPWDPGGSSPRRPSGVLAGTLLRGKTQARRSSTILRSCRRWRRNCEATGSVDSAVGGGAADGGGGEQRCRGADRALHGVDSAKASVVKGVLAGGAQGRGLAQSPGGSNLCREPD